MSKKPNHLTPKEYEIMKILWCHNKPMLISEISAEVKNVAENSLHPMINSLIGKNYVKVVGNMKVSKTYSRLYSVAVTVNEYTAQQLVNIFNDTGKTFSAAAFLSYITKHSKNNDNDELINDLENYLEKAKSKISE